MTSPEPQVVSVRNGMFQVPVYRKGTGQPLLYLHAAGGIRKGMTPEMLALAEHYDVIVPTHPGWDETPGLEHIDDVHDMVVYYQDFCDAIGLTSFFLAGHSIGGMFAAELAAARPDMVKKLVLVCPVGLWMDEAPVTDLFILMPNEIPGVIFGDLSNPVIPKLFPPPANEEEMAEAYYFQLANFSATGKFIWPIPDKGLKKRLHRIKAPTLIVWGDQDRLVPPAYAELFRSKIPNAQVAMIPGAGHMVPLENTPEFTRVVTEFLG
ncbi:alpha/beta fold hydrolase [Tepidiforma thermophila]|uniref:Pimeloyl-ACP methyl ester carboxylesterase n=1 Tax=Tepidiforma thermophila (strain KCTC 52669 / CGMCC 1.13589 / G233) TaxID=2761530 RepID=A0A2A9HAG4_TEPT2|nr:alpha/beta hydrolase [Tepidiforma thermophila]PFG72924.1 pimeloyl-ACP methyl ester carboxylesterase [Tepidiforma thermophila]